MRASTKILIADGSTAVSKEIAELITNGYLFDDERDIDIILYGGSDNNTIMNDDDNKGRVMHFQVEDTSAITKDIDYAFLIAPKNSNIHNTYSFFRHFGEILGKNSKSSIKIVILSEPINVNTLIAYRAAIKNKCNISSSNFTGLTLNHKNRLKNYLAKRMKRNDPEDFDDSIIWGSNVADISNVRISDVYKGRKLGFIFSSAFIEKEIMGKFNETTNIEKKHHIDPSKSIYNECVPYSAIQHMKFLIYGTKEGSQTSMSVFVPRDEPYGISHGIFFSLPVVITKDKENCGNEIKIIKTKCIPLYLRKRLDEEELFILKTINRECSN